MKNQTNAPIISIIVPVYQVAPYLRECLDSIVSQTFTGWEMILIDDGSTDGGELICDEYGERDERIRVFHRENRGLSAALNYGLDISRGECIAIVDADDVLLSHDYLSILYDALKRNDAQVSVCRMKNYPDGSPAPEPVLGSDSITILSGKDVFTKEPYRLDTGAFSISCSKLYRKSCFEGIRYPVGRIMEDVAVFHRLIYPCQRIVSLEDIMYGRRIREGSITTGMKAGLQYKEAMDAVDDCITYFEEINDQRAADYTRKRKKRHTCYYYFEAIKDGSLEDIPVEIRPDITDVEAELGHTKLLRSFRRADPEQRSPQTIKYLSTLGNRAFQLLRMSHLRMLRSDIRFDISASEADLFYKLAAGEGLLVTAHAAFGEPSDEYTDMAVRSYILTQHTLKTINRDLSSDDGRPVLIPLIPSKVMALYTEPWLRWAGSCSFLADSGEKDSVGQLMKRNGFTESNTGSLETDRLRSTSFKNRDSIELKLFFDVPPTVSGIYGDHLRTLFKELIRDRREMTMTEFALFLILKLHLPNAHALSACLNDLLDLTLILHAYPELICDDAFLKRIKELQLEDTWCLIRVLCEKVMSPPDTQTAPGPDQLDYLSSLIARALPAAGTAGVVNDA